VYVIGETTTTILEEDWARNEEPEEINMKELLDQD